MYLYFLKAILYSLADLKPLCEEEGKTGLFLAQGWGDWGSGWLNESQMNGGHWQDRAQFFPFSGHLSHI